MVAWQDIIEARDAPKHNVEEVLATPEAMLLCIYIYTQTHILALEIQPLYYGLVNPAVTWNNCKGSLVPLSAQMCSNSGPFDTPEKCHGTIENLIWKSGNPSVARVVWIFQGYDRFICINFLHVSPKVWRSKLNPQAHTTKYAINKEDHDWCGTRNQKRRCRYVV